MEEKRAKLFQIHEEDNVATALTDLQAGKVLVVGSGDISVLEVTETIPRGHKAALRDIEEGAMIQKYGVPIGKATCSIRQGQWVHLHCMKSNYDERSSHLDLVTGAPKDMEYTL